MKSQDEEVFRTELKKISEDFRDDLQKAYKQELINSLRPANEVILDDVDLQNLLKVSKRHTAVLREKRLIDYSQPIPKGKVYYTLGATLDFIKSGWIQSVSSQRKL